MKLIAGIPGRPDTWEARGMAATMAALAMVTMFAARADAAGAYAFTKVVDSVADGFNTQTLRVSCPSINNPGDIAFKSSRGAADGVYRANAIGGVTTITEVEPREGLLANGHPSMNDSGQVSFGASPSSDGGHTIVRSDGRTATTIARTGTSTEDFASFGDNTSINNDGEVAFDGALVSRDRGLFSGAGGATTTHYRTNQDASVDDGSARFNATTDRPSINDGGDIAFLDQIQGTFRQDIFRGQEGGFNTISTTDSQSHPPTAFTPPILNNQGMVLWQTQFFDDTGFAVRAIVKGDGVAPTTNVVDSSGAFDLFHAYALNDTGAVAFSATLDEDELGIPSIFVGPDPKKDRLIGPGDKLDGGTVVGLGFCEEGLNNNGELAFVAEIEDGKSDDVRVALFRATPGT